MSIEATSWALSVNGLQDATERAILLGLANHATRDGSAAWPSVATLAEYAVCSTRTVQRRLRSLEGRGFIQKGDQRLVNHLQANHRPVVYDLPIGVTHRHPSTGSEETGVTPGASRGDTAGTAGVTPVSPKPSMNHPEPSTPPIVPPTGDGEQGQLLTAEAPKQPATFVYPDAFEQLWAAWPKKGDNKRPAHASWVKVTQGTSKRPAQVTPEQLQQAVEQFAADPNLPDPATEGSYIPAMTTWLNQGRWENGPLPARRRGGNRPQAGDTDRAMRRGLSAAQRYRQLEESNYQAPQQSQEPRMITDRRTA